MKVMVLLLVLLLVDGIASVCMSTNGTTQGLSVYQRVCCVINNLGRSHTIKENGITQYIFCPTVQPKSCPGIDLTISILVLCNYRKRLQDLV